MRAETPYHERKKPKITCANRLISFQLLLLFSSNLCRQNTAQRKTIIRYNVKCEVDSMVIPKVIRVSVCVCVCASFERQIQYTHIKVSKQVQPCIMIEFLYSWMVKRLYHYN